jgi:hypothetical protein
VRIKALAFFTAPFDFPSVSDYTRIPQQRFDLYLRIRGHLRDIETVEGLSESLAFSQDATPGKTGLHCLQQQELEMTLFVVKGGPPFFIVIPEIHGVRAAPGATL